MLARKTRKSGTNDLGIDASIVSLGISLSQVQAQLRILPSVQFGDVLEAGFFEPAPEPQTDEEIGIRVIFLDLEKRSMR